MTTIREINPEDYDDYVGQLCRSMWNDYMQERLMFPSLPKSAQPPTPADFQKLKETGKLEWTTKLDHTTVRTIYEILPEKGN